MTRKNNQSKDSAVALTSKSVAHDATKSTSELSSGSPSNSQPSILRTILLVVLLLVTASSAQLALAPFYGQLLVEQAVTYVTLISIGMVEVSRFSGISILAIDANAILSMLVSFTPALLEMAPKSAAPDGGPRPLLTTAATLVLPLVSIVWCLRRALDSFGALNQDSTRSIGTAILLAGSITTVLPISSTALQAAAVSYNIVSPLLVPLVLANVVTYLSTEKSSRRLAFLGMTVSTAIIYAVVYGPAGSLISVNRSLSLHSNSTGWTILDREWSNTGYVSVLENKETGYRLLRCDHSFLGGEWLPPNTSPVGEPVYVVFTLLEAVRLIDRPEPHAEKSALVVGLGIGSAPKALLAHGLDTTIVELDPAVHAMATKHFSLPSNHTSVIADAASWVTTQSSDNPSKKYDYIIHDVFTGGHEPLDLFTIEFLRSLRSLLAPNGAMALNYAGDVDAPLTRNVLHTIHQVLGTSCRIFRDMDAPDASSESNPTSDTDPKDQDHSFANLVVFCLPDGAGATGRKMDEIIADPAHRKPFYFRGTNPADFLGSPTRKEYLMPKAQLEMQFPKERRDGTGLQVLTKGTVRKFKSQQVESARRHWRIMRQSVPDAVWEVY